mmetsp:Transcript_15341/g.30948  ORF Transcript_15341/g.30948 Transcript_15341/m.30948 type:complete len:459 (-) Transcript_15341:2002-3378(-)
MRPLVGGSISVMFAIARVPMPSRVSAFSCSVRGRRSVSTCATSRSIRRACTTGSTRACCLSTCLSTGARSGRECASGTLSKIQHHTARLHSTSTSNTAEAVSDDETTSSIPSIDPTKPYFPIYYNDVYEVILPPNHRFPMEMYGKVRRRVQNLVSTLPASQQSIVQCDFRVSPLATVQELTTTHSHEYVKNFLSGNQTEAEIRNVGFPWSPSGVDRALSSVGGTVAAACSVCDAIRERKSEGSTDRTDGDGSISEVYAPTWSAHVAGGTHHAFYDYGEWFCVFSDIAVAANVVLEQYPDVVRRILIIDLDVHQGNGNAVLFQGRDDVVTFSMHCQKNYFSEVQESDLDIELPEHCTDQTYLATLSHWLRRINEEGGDYDLVFFQAGVDIIKDDRLGRLSVTSDGVARRNDLVYDFVARADLPLVITMGGGYPAKDWEPILAAHANVYFSAHQYLSRLK